MPGIERFEDLVAWQKAREVTRELYRVTSDGPFSRDWGLRDQIRRAAVSVMSNIAEGFERSGSREFHQFLVIAKGSCAEVRSQLYVAYDIGYLDDASFEDLHSRLAALQSWGGFSGDFALPLQGSVRTWSGMKTRSTEGASRSAES